MFKINNSDSNNTITGEYSNIHPDAMSLMKHLLKGELLIHKNQNTRIQTEEIAKGWPIQVLDFGQRRNKVILIQYNGRRYVAKRFKKPNIINGVIKRITATKAQKAFRNANLLIEKGFKTAAPVIWWEEHNALAVTDSWLITEYVHQPLISEMREYKLNKGQKEWLMSSVSHYLLSLHKAGFIPYDFNVGNVLYSATDSTNTYTNTFDSREKLNFYIIDINRMGVGSVPGFGRAMKSFDQLGVKEDEYPYLLYPYVDARGWSREKSVAKIKKIRLLSDVKKFLRHPFK